METDSITSNTPRQWVANAGGLNAVAARLGVTNKRLDQWLRRGIPHEWVVPLADAIGMEPAILSPRTAEKIVAPWVKGNHSVE